MQTRQLAVVVLVAVVVAVTAPPAAAQSCGGCAGPAVTSAPSGSRAWPGAGSLGLRIFDEYEVKDRSYRGRDRAVNDFSEDLYVNRTAAALRYAATDDWAAELTLTHVHFSYTLKPPGASARIKRVFAGIGDTSIFLGRGIDLGPPGALDTTLPADPAAPPPGGPHLGVWLGVSVPTGNPERPDPRIVTRDVSVTNLQTGTGTWDPQARVRLDLPAGAVTWFAEVGARVPVTENRYDYRTGATCAAAVGLGTPLAGRLSGGLALTFQDVGRDRFQGDRVAVGGGRWLYATPSVSYRVAEDVAIDLSVRITAWRDVDTKLSDSSYAVQLGLSFDF